MMGTDKRDWMRPAERLWLLTPCFVCSHRGGCSWLLMAATVRAFWGLLDRSPAGRHQVVKCTFSVTAVSSLDAIEHWLGWSVETGLLVQGAGIWLPWSPRPIVWGLIGTFNDALVLGADAKVVVCPVSGHFDACLGPHVEGLEDSVTCLYQS